MVATLLLLLLPLYLFLHSQYRLIFSSASAVQFQILIINRKNNQLLLNFNLNFCSESSGVSSGVLQLLNFNFYKGSNSPVISARTRKKH